MKTIIVWDKNNREAIKLLASYLASCLTDNKLAKAFKELKGREMELGSQDGSIDFEFSVNGSIAFNKFFDLSNEDFRGL